MTPGQIIALVRDVVILIALGLLIWLLISYGKDVVKVSDMRAVQKQIDTNAQTEAQWRKEQTDANQARDTQIAQVGAAIASQRAPVRLCGPTRASPLPSPTAAPSGSNTVPGGTDSGSGVDLRPAINAFELKYETAFASCRAALAGWPR